MVCPVIKGTMGSDLMLDFIITANSPGEVAAWVQPVVKKIKQKYKQSQISVFLPPCVFASGSEKEVLADFSEVDHVFAWKQYLKFILLNRKPNKFKPGVKGVVLFLGGDIFHAFLLGKKLGYPVLAYTEGDYGWAKYVRKFMVPDYRVKKKLLEKGADDEKIEVIGNLMLDSLTPKYGPEAFRDYLELKNEKVITLFPGSRVEEFKLMLPLFINGLLEFGELDDNYKVLLSQSPFIDDKQIADYFLKYLSRNNLKGQFLKKDGYNIMHIFDKLQIKVYENLNYSLMQITDLAISAPGTNNLELAYFGIPMIVILPLNKPEIIPLRGLKGLIGEIPYLGAFLKKKIIPKIAAEKDFISLPNIISEKNIVPELVGKLKPQDLTEKIRQYINNENELLEMHKELKGEFTEVSASDKIVENIDQILGIGGI